MKNDPPASAFRAKLRACVAEELDAHWRQLDGGHCRNLRALVLGAAEEELCEFAMRRANQNQNDAAKILGVSRATLNRKLNSHPPHSHPPRAHSHPRANSRARPANAPRARTAQSARAKKAKKK